MFFFLQFKVDTAAVVAIKEVVVTKAAAAAEAEVVIRVRKVVTDTEDNRRSITIQAANLTYVL